MHKDDLDKLRDWFLSQKRDLPWRETPTPYAVWVSEVMLQQTQVATVIPYFESWMRRFPTIHDLANASLEAVLKEWEGLGYYSRARHLHAGACHVVEHYAGQLPDSAESLKKIKGLGPYTVGAILSFAFHQRQAAVDGNVLRVLARYYALEKDISKASSIKSIHVLAQDLLPTSEPWVINEGLIELGATICGKTPKCLECPLNQRCRAHKLEKAHLLPIKSAKTATTPLYRAVGVIACDKHLLVKQGEKGKIMADLYEFPYFQIDQKADNLKNILKQSKQTWSLQMEWQQALTEVKHSFTRYRAHLFPHLFVATRQEKIENYQWISIESLKKCPFSSGHRRIFAEIQRILK